MNIMAVRLGNTTFDRKMFVQEFNEPTHINSTVVNSLNDKHIVFQSKLKTPYFTLVSRLNGYLGEQNKDNILADYAMLDTTFELELSNGTIENVRFAHERGISFQEVIEGCGPYTAIINLAKVII